MSDLEWTDEPPEEPGWYWHRSDLTGTVAVMEVLESPHGRDYMIARYPNGNRFALDDGKFNSSEWAGPIPEPDEPVEADDECQTCYGVGLVEEIVTDEHHVPVKGEDGLYSKKTTPCPECRSEERDTEPDSVIRGKPSAA